jgi:hypothetical protein
MRASEGAFVRIGMLAQIAPIATSAPETAAMSTCNYIPRTVEASLDARLAPFHGVEPRSVLEDLDVEVSRAVSPHERSLRLSLVKDLKLLFAALGAGGSVVPLGDNGRTARLLSEYASALREH